MVAFRLSAARGALLAAIALGTVLAASIGIPQAHAQFVCGGSATGAEAQAGAGATAAGGAANVACGPSADASGAFSGNTATGFAATASGAISFNTAIGIGANASGAGSVNTAVGGFSTATGLNSSAFGNGASATFANSAAFGNGATATRANQQVFGTATNTYTTPGITSAASKAAQTGPLQIVTSDATGNLATNTAAGLGLASSTDISTINSQLGTINSQLGIINSRLGIIDSRLNDLDSRTARALNGTSMAFAMAGVPWLERGERFAVSANWGTFQGTNGLALNAALRLSTNVQGTAGVAYGANGGRQSRD